MIRVAGILGLVVVALASWAGGANEPTEPKVVSRPPVPLNRQGTVLLDRDGKRLLLKAKVAARDRVLEMLCCLKQTKEHESILSLDASAAIVHAGLLALGAKPGKPVRYVREVAPGKFEPDFHPPSGQRIEVFLQWSDSRGRRHRVRAQEWVRKATQRYFSTPMQALPDGVVLPKEPELVFDARNKELVWFGQMKPVQRDVFLKLSDDRSFIKAVRRLYANSQPTPMRAHWVFAGSGFSIDPQTKKKFYLAENGSLICVANFASATLDIAVASSDKGDNLLFEAYTDRIPPVDTAVLIELIPKSSPVRKTSPPPPPLPRQLSG
ncbi:MAG: hypothetical protein CMJ65_02905 [Planctomycetaceae bacterium]|jgi:hypothetical protein|nr:hypothetical protein [Planctomycetaceae bacterium]MDP7276841.1 YdjY domain-containing protein [Planctomycetaceae bacterium]